MDTRLRGYDTGMDTFRILAGAYLVLDSLLQSYSHNGSMLYVIRSSQLKSRT